MKKTKSPIIAAAISGLILGATSGCSADDPAAKPADPGTNQKPADPGAGKGTDPAAKEVAKHACKGLNGCKNQGASGKNECKSKGDCATVAHHSCKGKNTCKGKGGCGSGDNGCKAKNSCKGKGGCKVPVKH
jgi:hypothetical protein